MAKNIASENIFDGLKGAPEPEVVKQEEAPVVEVANKPGTQVLVQQPVRGENRTVRMQLVVTPSLKKRVSKVAKQAGVSINELVNQLLDQYCAGVEEPKGPTMTRLAVTQSFSAAACEKSAANSKSRNKSWQIGSV